MMTPDSNPQPYSQSTPMPRKLWILWFIVSLFYAFQYLLRVSPSVMMTSILQHFTIDARDFGHFSGAYYLGYALMHIPIGLMLNRIQLRWVLAGSIMVSVSGLLPLVYGCDWRLAIIGRFMVGAGSSGAILSLFSVIQTFFPERLFSRLLGIGVTIGLLGAIYGGGPVDHISQSWGWQNVLWLFFCVGICLSLAVIVLTPTRPVQHQQQDQIQLSLKHQLIVVFTNKRVLLTALFAALMVGPIEGFADVWALPFLETVYQYDRATAITLPPLIFLGMCVGSPLLSTIAEKYKIYDYITMACALGMAIVFIVLLSSQPSVITVGILFSIVGILSAYQVLVMYRNSKNIEARFGSLATAITNMIIMSFGSIFHFAIPEAMRMITHNQNFILLEANQINAYRFGIGVIPIALLMALVGFITLSHRNMRK